MVVKERPILFSGPMVRPILNMKPDVWPPEAIDPSKPIKWNTRRVINPQPHGGIRKSPFVPSGIEDGHGREIKLKHGSPGDRLWVRETFCLESNFNLDDEIGYPPPFKDGRPIKWTDDEYHGKYWEQPHYRATDPMPELYVEGKEDPGVIWKPSIFMPRWVSRINLEIMEIRVERIQDISKEDAISEGIQSEHSYDGTPGFGYDMGMWYKDYSYKYDVHVQDPIYSFMTLWDSINLKRGYGWEKNPWVWVVVFRRIK